MNLVSTTPFTMTKPVSQLLWGQILKDVEFYDQEDSARFVVILAALGYTRGSKFMTREYDILVETSKEGQ